ncbi:MAG: GNAT family protein [Lachnospiraceae bacterium]|nr:GNAT family protein [Lachnospiraceae bacterium]
MLVGDKVILRALREEDLPQLMEWRNLPNFKRNFREYRELNMTMQKSWYDKLVVGDPGTIMFAICEKETKELLGCCGLCYINWVQRNADISLYVGYQESYIDDEGIAKEACTLMFDYGFNELNLHRLWTELYEYDQAKVDFFTKEFGFNKDGELRDNHYMDGRWWNSHIYSLLESEYKEAYCDGNN